MERLMGRKCSGRWRGDGGRRTRGVMGAVPGGALGTRPVRAAAHSRENPRITCSKRSSALRPGLYAMFFSTETTGGRTVRHSLGLGRGCSRGGPRLNVARRNDRGTTQRGWSLRVILAASSWDRFVNTNVYARWSLEDVRKAESVSVSVVVVSCGQA